MKRSSAPGYRGSRQSPRGTVRYGADSVGISKIDCDDRVVGTVVENAQDVGHDQAARKRADERSADRNAGDVEHAATSGRRIRPGLDLLGDFNLVGPSEGPCPPRAVGKCIGGVRGCREGTQDHVEIFDRTIADPSVNDAGKAGVAQLASGNDGVESGQCNGRLIAFPTAMDHRVKVRVERPFHDSGRQAEAFEGFGHRASLAPIDHRARSSRAALRCCLSRCGRSPSGRS